MYSQIRRVAVLHCVILEVSQLMEPLLDGHALLQDGKTSETASNGSISALLRLTHASRSSTAEEIGLS
jgi:hypothetical protein